MKKVLFLATALLCLSTQQGFTKTKTVKLRLIETSDVHGHFFPYDFIERKPIKGTLARVSTYVNRLREENPDGVILIDNGDILQGQPTCYYTNFVATSKTNIAAQVVNYMNYDAQTVGNHDVEPGHAVYDKWIREVACPTLGANIVSRDSQQPYVKPYAIIERQGVKVAVIGMLTPAIPNWLKENLWSGLEFKEMVATAKKWVAYIQQNEKPDLIVGLFHSGTCGGITTPDYQEDASHLVAKEVPGFDIIFFGHDHQVHNDMVRCNDGHDVLCLDPSCYAVNVSDATVELTIKNGKVTKKKITGKIQSVADEEVDQKLLAHFGNEIGEVRNFVERQIGVMKNKIASRDCFFGPAAFTDMIHRLQLDFTGADISFNAPLVLDKTIDAGPIYMSDMFKLYKFENLIYVLRMTGEEVRKHLEMSYDLWVNTMQSPDDHILRLNSSTKGDMQRYGFENFTFNFDSAAGIDYEVDVTKPDGQKVRILRMSNGKPFDEKKWYRVVMNSYRGNGGGELLTKGAGIPKEELEDRIMFESQFDQRHYLTQQIERSGVVEPEIISNWRFVPEEWTKPALKRDRQLLFKD